MYHRNKNPQTCTYISNKTVYKRYFESVAYLPSYTFVFVTLIISAEGFCQNIERFYI